MGQCQPLHSRPYLDVEMAKLLFSASLLEQLILHAQVGEQLLQPPTLFHNGLRPGNNPRIHTS